jgi:uncharacterized protein
MTQYDRRSFLRGATAVAGGVALGGPFTGFLTNPLAAQVDPRSPTLGPVPDERGGVVRLWLPDGFHYRSFHDTATAQTLDDGTLLPARHDGMAAFAAPDQMVWLVRNHEINGPGTAFGPATPTPYDTATRSGTTTTLVDLFGVVDHAFTSLNGTQMNCAGGRTPWDSWISCEETVNGPDVGPDFTGASNVTLTQRHGFIFEVPAGGQSDRDPITSAGRFAHEAAAFDPADGTLYLTEDNFGFASGFYRYLPSAPTPGPSPRLADGGQLQMLAVVGQPNANLGASQAAGATYPVTWVDIDDPAPSFPYTPGVTAPTTNDQAIRYVGDQGRAQGAAWFSRLEGAVIDRGVVYFTSTQGGGPAETSVGPIADGFGNGSGQVWGYHTRTDTLHLVYESPGPATLDLPDNVTVRRRQGTLVLCEDGTNDNYLRCLTPGGRLFDLALNRLPGQFNDEFAGATFSPDGHTLFVNIQASRALTFAIWGPWDLYGV